MNNLEIYLLRGLITLWLFGTEECTYMVDTMVRRDMEICISVVSRIKGISGKKCSLKEHNLSIDSVTLLLFIRILCLYLEDGMATTP